MLTDKQSKQFIDWYNERYNNPKELPKIYANEEYIEESEWMDKLKEILGKKYNTTYKIRKRWKETILEKVFNELWLEYWPIILPSRRTFTQYTPNTLWVPKWRHEVIINCFDDIQEHIDKTGNKNFRVSYLKEKYWSLRVERQWADDWIDEKCSELENITETICSICWKKGKVRYDLFWFECLCLRHYLHCKLIQLWWKTKRMILK